MDTADLEQKKVLVIAYGFPPIAHAGVYRTMRFCRYLPANGWRPTVITINESKDIHSDHSLMKRIPPEVRIHRTYILDIWRMIQRYRARDARREAARAALSDPGSRAGVAGAVKRVERFFLSALLKIFSIPDHMVFWIPFAVIRGIRLMRKEDFDVIFTTSPPHSEHLAGLILAKIFRKPWVADFRDPIVDNFHTEELFRIELWLHGLLERIIARFADTVILVTESHRQSLKNRYPAMGGKFVVVRNGFDPALFKNIQPDSFDRFTILFGGTLYGTISPDFFIHGLARWLETKDPSVRDNVQALFYGMGCEKAGALAHELGLEHVVRTSGLIPHDEIIRKQKGADLLLLIIGHDSKSAGVITSKLYEYMAVKRPILAIMQESEALDIIRDYGNFYHAPHDDYPSLLKALDNAYEEYLRKGRAREEQNREQENEKLAPGFDNSRYDVTVQVKDLIHIFNESNIRRAGVPGEHPLP